MVYDGVGFLGAVAVAAICLLDIMKEPRAWRRHLPTLVVCAGLTVGGLLLKVHVPRHAAYQAQSLMAFQLALGKNLAWPSSFHAWLVPLNLLPLILLAWKYSHAREKSSAAERMTLAVGAWGVLQAAAAAYARGEDGTVPAWRYMDTESFIMIANCLSIVLLVRHYGQQLARKKFWYAAFVLWGVACVWGLLFLTKMVESEPLPDWQARQEKRLAYTRAFMATDDEQVLHTRFRGDLPYPDTAVLASLLRDQDIRRILPACAREPLTVASAGNSDGAFVVNGSSLTNRDAPGERCWGSFSGAGARARGTFESAAVGPGAFPYLEIPVAGDLGEAGLSLELVGLKTGKVTAVAPKTVPGEKWANVVVKTPAEEFKIMARDDSDTKWFAFKEPREMGWLSYWSRQMLKTCRCCLLAGGVCLIWGLAVWARPEGRKAA